MINKRNWSLTYFFKKVYCGRLSLKFVDYSKELQRMCGIIRIFAGNYNLNDYGIFAGNYNLNDYEKNHELGVFLHPRLQ